MEDERQIIEGYMERARRAFDEVADWDQTQTDEAVRVIGKAIFDNADELAAMAAEETAMGIAEDKAAKNRNKARIIWNDLKDKNSVGIVDRDEKTGIVTMAKPMGIVAAITPATNPIVTPMSNAMFAVKGRNAIIISPHHRAVNCSGKAVEYINKALSDIGAPEHLVQILTQHSRENTRLLMASADVVISTGGAGMVKAAYSSGRPALGVGAGNVQCIVDDDADLKKAVPLIVTGRTFDNGILCSAEQSIIINKSRYEELRGLLLANNTYIVENPDEREGLRKALFPDGAMNPGLIGQSTGKVAAAANIDIPADTRMIAVLADKCGKEDLFAREKMFPVVAIFLCGNFKGAVEIAAANLETEGAGHSVSIHSNDTANIEYAALRLPVSRIVVNQCSATATGGSFRNGLAPTNTLGCGSWGGNSISENLTYKHLLNYSRVAYYLDEKPIPDDNEIWG